VVARALVASIVFVASGAASCVGHVPPTLEDSRGVRVEWRCSDGTCEVTATSDPPPACTALPDLDLFVLGAGSFALLCGASVVDHTLVLHDDLCRPILCADESGCPQWDDRRYACDGGVCRTTGRAPDLLDVLAACLAHVERPLTCAAAQTDAPTLAALALARDACDATTCIIPEACAP
jgi:hypothetical protein